MVFTSHICGIIQLHKCNMGKGFTYVIYTHKRAGMNCL